MVWLPKRIKKALEASLLGREDDTCPPADPLPAPPESVEPPAVSAEPTSSPAEEGETPEDAERASAPDELPAPTEATPEPPLGEYPEAPSPSEEMSADDPTPESEAAASSEPLVEAPSSAPLPEDGEVELSEPAPEPPEEPVPSRRRLPADSGARWVDARPSPEPEEEHANPPPPAEPEEERLASGRMQAALEPRFEPAPRDGMPQQPTPRSESGKEAESAKLSVQAQLLVERETSPYRDLFKNRASEILFIDLSGPDTPERFPSHEAEDAYLMAAARRALDKAREQLAPIELRLSDRAAERLLREMLDTVVGFGPIQSLLEDDTVSEVMVNGPNRVYLERSGRVRLAPCVFESETQLLQVIHKIVSPLGRRVDRTMPICDARLPDGSRVNIVIPPLALNGPTMTVRKFSKKPLGMKDLLAKGSLDAGMSAFLDACIRLKLNMIVSGGTGSGKTTTLNILSSCIEPEARIVTLEDAAELQLQQEHVISLESRPPNVEGAGEVPLRLLLRNALRMRPDRLVVGECRGAEALDMLQAMNTGQEGSLTTGHANTPQDMISRLETMVMMAGMPLSSKTIREQIARSLDLIVQQARFSDGTRKIVAISEVRGMEGDRVALVDVFRHVKEGIREDGKILGRFEYTGNPPSFLIRFQDEGVPVPDDMFGPGVSVARLIKKMVREREREQRRERRALGEKAARSAAEDAPYEQSSLMMSIRGMRVLSWKTEQCGGRPDDSKKAVQSELAAPLADSRQIITDKEIQGPMRDWLQAELADRLKRLVAFERMELRFDTQAEERDFLRQKLRYCFQDLAATYRMKLSAAVLDDVLEVALRDAAALGPIQPLLDDPTVDEVMVNGPFQVYAERRGRLEPTEVVFRDEAHVRHVIDRILSAVGRRVDDSNPIADARLQDGSRVNVVLPPVSLVGPTLTIRKFSAKALQVADLVGRRTLSSAMARFLEACVKAKISLIVAGGTGSGKTSTLNALSAFIPEGERVVTIEDAAELRLQQPHVVPLESRPANREGTGAVAIRELVRNSLRMRPDRVVIGECRGPEALDMLQAMNTGHEGSMTTAHANSPRDLVARIETMVMMGTVPLTSRAIREQIFGAIQLVIQQERLPDGSRRITSLSEYTDLSNDQIVTSELFRFEKGSEHSDDPTRDPFAAGGCYPRFLEELALSGVNLPDDLFGPGTSIAAEVSRRQEARVRQQREEMERWAGQVDKPAGGPEEAGSPADTAFHWMQALPASAAGAEDGLGKDAKELLHETRSRTREWLKNAVTKIAIPAVGLLEDPPEDEIIRTVKSCLDHVLALHPEVEMVRKDRINLIADIVDEVTGLGPIQQLMEDVDVSEIMVNGPFKVYVERLGKLELTDVTFRDDEHAAHVLNRILTPRGRRCDIKSPLVDARLDDGSRIHAAIPPVALNGPTLTIRRFSQIPYDLEKLVEAGALPGPVGAFLRACVRMRLNIVISGGTGSGKTTMLNALSGEIPEGERVITIEDSAELSLQVPHVVGLEARMANTEGSGLVPVRELVRNSLRMRPDRIVVGECRGAEALDMLQAMNTGHEGSMTTAHANNARELLARIETMVLMAGSGATVKGIREQVASAVDLIIQVRRFHGGRRRVVQVTELLGMNGDDLETRDLFLWHSEGIDADGHPLGGLIATGQNPSFLDRMAVEGCPPPPGLFAQPDGDVTSKRLQSMQAMLKESGVDWPF